MAVRSRRGGSERVENVQILMPCIASTRSVAAFCAVRCRGRETRDGNACDTPDFDACVDKGNRYRGPVLGIHRHDFCTVLYLDIALLFFNFPLREKIHPGDAN